LAGRGRRAFYGKSYRNTVHFGVRHARPGRTRGNPLADQSGYYDGSNVDLVVEIADAREAQRSYEANLRVFDQARQMSQSLLELLKR
jgi:flagellar basal body rod protein FlgG